MFICEVQQAILPVQYGHLLAMLMLHNANYSAIDSSKMRLHEQFDSDSSPNVVYTVPRNIAERCGVALTFIMALNNIRMTFLLMRDQCKIINV